MQAGVPGDVGVPADAGVLADAGVPGDAGSQQTPTATRDPRTAGSAEAPPFSACARDAKVTTMSPQLHRLDKSVPTTPREGRLGVPMTSGFLLAGLQLPTARSLFLKFSLISALMDGRI